MVSAVTRDPPSPLPPEVLDKLRRSVPLRMTAMGAFLLDGQPVEHPRVIAALRAGLGVATNGELRVGIGAHWVYLEVDDTPLRATAVAVTDDGTLTVRLDDGRSVALDPSTLWDEPDRGLRCRVVAADDSGPLPVRFTNRAQMDLTPWLEVDDDDTPVLVLPAGRHPIPSTPP